MAQLLLEQLNLLAEVMYEILRHNELIRLAVLVPPRDAICLGLEFAMEVADDANVALIVDVMKSDNDAQER